MGTSWGAPCTPQPARGKAGGTHDGFPTEPGRVANGMDVGLEATVVHNVQPAVVLKPLGRLRFIARYHHHPNRRVPFDLDEPHVDARSGSPRDAVGGGRTMGPHPANSMDAIFSIPPFASAKTPRGSSPPRRRANRPTRVSSIRAELTAVPNGPSRLGRRTPRAFSCPSRRIHLARRGRADPNRSV